MRRALAVLLLLAGCGEPADSSAANPFVELGPSFVSDPSFRRAALEDSLVDRSNGYARLRLEQYGGAWDTLPIRNFAVRPVTESDFGTFVAAPYRKTEGPFDPAFRGVDWTEESLVALGKHAFHYYPLELAPRFLTALTSPDAADEFGLWRHDGRVGGLVRARLDDGSETVASTCATCHASSSDGELIDGRANPWIDNDAMSRGSRGGHGSAWGPGAADVTDDGTTNPVAITDLRPIRHQNRLHWAATLYNSPEALAVRIETLMITSAGSAMRPPREVAVALAAYLWSLSEAEPPDAPDAPGAAVFDRECASCHGALDVVPIEMVGTDPAAGRSTMRGTGDYRVPSLVEVGTRAQFLHEGRLKTLEQLFDPTRLPEVPGHVYGTNVDLDEREALVEYLREL